VSDETPCEPTRTDKEQHRLEASLAAVHTTGAAICADLVQLAAAGDVEAEEDLARGDAHFQEHYGYAPGDGPATVTESALNDD
jgi:hypothetical protein